MARKKSHFPALRADHIEPAELAPMHPHLGEALAIILRSRASVQTIYDWLQEIGYKVKRSPYSPDVAPYTRVMFDWAKDTTLRELTFPCSVQSGKSIFAQGVLHYYLDNEYN